MGSSAAWWKRTPFYSPSEAIASALPLRKGLRDDVAFEFGDPALPRRPRAAAPPARDDRRARARGHRTGAPDIVLPDGTRLQIPLREPGREAELRIVHWRALARLAPRRQRRIRTRLCRGRLGSPDLVALLGLCADNAEGRARQIIRGSGPAVVARRLLKALRRNTKTGSRRNIMAHYDLGNPFLRGLARCRYDLFFGLYEEADDTLEIAQRRKFDRITELLKLDGAPSVLEIAAAGAALAAHLGRVKAPARSTPSPSRRRSSPSPKSSSSRSRGFRHGRARTARLSRRRRTLRPRRLDRNVRGGRRGLLADLFQTPLRQALKTGGRRLLQVITIAEDRFDHYRSHPDMIQTMVFPAACCRARARW